MQQPTIDNLRKIATDFGAGGYNPALQSDNYIPAGGNQMQVSPTAKTTPPPEDTFKPVYANALNITRNLTNGVAVTGQHLTNVAGGITAAAAPAKYKQPVRNFFGDVTNGWTNFNADFNRSVDYFLKNYGKHNEDVSPLLDNPVSKTTGAAAYAAFPLLSMFAGGSNAFNFFRTARPVVAATAATAALPVAANAVVGGVNAVEAATDARIPTRIRHILDSAYDHPYLGVYSPIVDEVGANYAAAAISAAGNPDAYGNKELSRPSVFRYLPSNTQKLINSDNTATALEAVFEQYKANVRPEDAYRMATGLVAAITNNATNSAEFTNWINTQPLAMRSALTQFTKLSPQQQVVAVRRLMPALVRRIPGQGRARSQLISLADTEASRAANGKL